MCLFVREIHWYEMAPIEFLALEVEMYRKAFPFVAMLGLLLTLMAVQSIAQTKELVADIPFDFTVCREQFSAGKYHIRPLSNANPNVVLVQSENKRSSEIVCAHDVQSRKAVTTGKLIFHRYGTQYFLSEMWMVGEKIGTQVVKSEKEEALQKEVRGVKREKITIKVTEVKP